MLTLRYELQEQLWANAQGTAYRAVDQKTNTPVELRFPRTEDELQWRAVLRRLRMARLVESAFARRLLTLEWETARPFYVVAPPPRFTLDGLFDFRHSMAVDDTVRVIHAVAGALVPAHRIGLSHGRLTAGNLGWSGPLDDATAFCVLDYTICPDDFRNDTAVDILQLFELWSRLIGTTGVPLEKVPPGMDRLYQQMGSADPSDRPSADTIRTYLGDWLKLNSTIILNPAAQPGTVVATPPAKSHSPDAFSETLPGPVSFAELQQSENPVEFSGNDPSIAAHGIGSTTTGDLHSQHTLIGSKERLEEEFPGTKGRDANSSPHFDEESFPQQGASGFGSGVEPTTLGRFRLLEKLGEGGMGTVWKGEDPVDGRIVAIKILRADRARDAMMLKRFHREARMLAEVNNPYVANMLEVNADGNTHYFVMEFVDGRNLLDFIRERGRLSERESASITADVARALLEAHERGIVHRDLKPENILIRREEPDVPSPEFPRVKLTDFGLARHVNETESMLLTAAGAVLGTPLYFSPEQCSGSGHVDVRADVYSLGATLYHTLVGRPPFDSTSILGLVNKHLNEPAPRVRTQVPELSDAVEEIVAKCLQKSPESRYENASSLLDDLDRLLRGEPTRIAAHPQLPTADARHVLAYDFTWELKSSPESLWPHVSNTERLNRAIGLPAIDYSAQPESAGGVKRFAQFRKMGMNIAWREHPFEWIEGRRLGVFREFHQGPWKWFTSVVEMIPRTGGGTTLTHRIRLLPANLVGKVAAQIEVGSKTKKALDKVYQRIDTVLSGGLGSLADPFEAAHDLPAEVNRKLEERLQRVIARGADPFVVERLGEFLATAPAQELSRIRPLALANRLSLDERQLLTACLIGAREGLLTMLWDIVCPICRIPSQVKDSLKTIREHGECEACQADFELDFANSIELIFRISSEIQDVETGMYCIGGPAHSPHVVAQVRLAPGERFLLDLSLAEGAYRLRGPQLPYVVEFRVVPQAHATRWELALARGPEPELPRQLKPGGQLFVLSNEAPHEVVARVERTASRSDACTAARAAATPIFRELFPNECLAPEQLVHVQQVTLLSTCLKHAGGMYFELGDSAAFGRLHAHFRELDEIIRREGGSLIKTVGEGVRAVFTEPVMAMRAALAMRALNEPALRVSVHKGSALVATINDHLDYFGSTVSIAERLLEAADERPDSDRPRVFVSDVVGDNGNVVAAARQAGARLHPRPQPLAFDEFATSQPGTTPRASPVYVLELTQ